MNTSWTDPFNERMKKRFFSSSLFQIVIGVFVGLVITGIGIYFITQTNKINEELEVIPLTGHEDVDLSMLDKELEDIPGATEVEKIARVGKEYLFLNDLDYYAYLHKKKIDELDRTEAIDSLVDISAMLQSGEEEGWIELTSETFNNPYKDHTKRAELLEEVGEKIEEKEENEGTIVETVTVWFWNMFQQELAKREGLDVAKAFAQEKIENVYLLVKNGTKTMEEAGEILKSDTSLDQLDKAYDSNAYGVEVYPYIIESVDDVKISSFSPEEFYQFIKDAEVGDLSEIILEKDSPDGERVVDSYYAFYKVQSKDKESFEFESWLSAFKESLEVEHY